MKQLTLDNKNSKKCMKFISVYDTDKDMLNAINIIYLGNKGFDLDPTYSKGVFYKDFQKPKLKSDLEPRSKDVKKSDCRNLDWIQSNSLNSIMFDPPFLFRDRKAINNDKMCGRFSYFQTFDDLLSMYRDSLKEFYRILVLKKFLVFKCQDMTDGSGSRPFFDTHCKIIKMAKEIGFSLQDIGILVRKNKIIKKAKKQGCLRKVHSYYIVFRKELNSQNQANVHKPKSI